MATQTTGARTGRAVQPGSLEGRGVREQRGPQRWIQARRSACKDGPPCDGALPETPAGAATGISPLDRAVARHALLAQARSKAAVLGTASPSESHDHQAPCLHPAYAEETGPHREAGLPGRDGAGRLPPDRWRAGDNTGTTSTHRRAETREARLPGSDVAEWAASD